MGETGRRVRGEVQKERQKGAREPGRMAGSRGSREGSGEVDEEGGGQRTFLS